MVFFLLAFAFTVLDGTGTVTSAFVGTTGAIVGCPIIWFIVSTWQKRSETQDRTPPPYLPAGEDYDDEELKARVFGPSPKTRSSSSEARSDTEGKTWYTPVTKAFQWAIISIRPSSTSAGRAVVDDV